jgi:hypothetical protein
MRWNQKEAALACGVPQNSWREWEAGRSPRNLVEVASKIGAVTGISEYWIITGRELDGGGGNAVTHQYPWQPHRWLTDQGTPKIGPEMGHRDTFSAAA